jgi:hypothetical protein
MYDELTRRQIGHLVPKQWRAQQRREDWVSEVGFTEHATLLLRGIEVAAAVLVLAFGVLLLVGYLVAERLTFC